MKVTLPPALVSAVIEQRAILFLGTGSSIGAVHPSNNKLPAGDGLRDLLSDKFLGGALKDRSLTAVAAMAASEAGLIHLQKFVREVFEPYAPADFHKLVPRFRWRAIATTNYDLIIERAYESVGKEALQNLVPTIKDGDLFESRSSEVSSPVGFFKLHGCIDHYTDEAVPFILGQEQYASYTTNRKRLFSRIRDLAYEFPIIFCGYSINDPHIQQILFDLTQNDTNRPQYYHIAPNTNDIEVRYWGKHQIVCLKATFGEFLGALDAAVPTTSRSLPVSLGGGELSIRSHYRVASATEPNEVALYLENDVTHVHSGMQVSFQSPQDFYKGLDRGFGCIAQNLDVRRQVCDSVLVDAVLLQEESRKTVELFMLKGPAGNGKTVALKRIAWDAAAIYGQLAFYVANKAAFRLEPLQEIYRLTGKRALLFVDHIALVREEVEKLLRACKANNLPITVIGAERDNEWNIYCEHLQKFVRQEFSVRYLTERAISALLDLLERHNALGLLSYRAPHERIEAFAQRAEKQLLVALHETTLGITFEKIVLDEFNSIEPVSARTLYLEICALHQFGARVRAGLISRTSGVSFETFGRTLIAPLDNVVLVEEDKHGKDIFYRSRHQHVAELVFNQALPTDDEKYDLLAKLMLSINTDYSSDRETWGRMVRGRSVGKMFVNVEFGRLFFDRAAEVTQADSFVLHQRAVFEITHPNGSLENAEQAAQRAFENNPQSRSIAHTQAEIARRQASATDDTLLKQSLRRTAREKLSKQGGRSTEYDVTTRAKLAVDELRELFGAGRGMEGFQEILLSAVKDAELTIQGGLQAFPKSAEILAVDAELKQLLDQADRARQALEKAFSINPRQDWLAVRLAKSYMQAGDFSAAQATLDRCLRENSQSKIAHLQMAHVARELKLAPALILDHLRRSFTPGDNLFEGQFWYAREQFIQGGGDEAKSLFAQINEHAPGNFRIDSSEPIRAASGQRALFQGRIERKEEGYAFIRFVDFKEVVFASRSDSDSDAWEGLRTGARIQAWIGFNRRGARALRVALV